MIRLRRRWLIGVPLGLLLLAIGGYFLWGASNRREVLRRIEALRAAGEPVDWEDLVWADSPAHENALGPLVEAAALAKRLDGAAWDEFGESVPRAHVEWTSEERKIARWAVDEFAEGFALIEEAERRRMLAPPPREHPLGSVPGFAEVARALDIPFIRARLEPERRESLVDLLLRLAAKASEGADDRGILKGYLASRAVSELCEGLDDGTLDPERNRESWGALLVSAEELGTQRDFERWERVFRIWLRECWRSRRDPLRDTREQLDQLQEDVGIRFLPGLPKPPWSARWYGHPFFDRDTLRLLDQHDERVAAADGPWKSQFVAKARLARIALHLHAHARRHAEPLELLEDYEEWIGGPLPADPISGRRFRYEASPDRATVWSPGKLAGTSREDLRMNELLWEIPYPKSD